MHPQALVELGVLPDDARNVTCFHGSGCPNCSGTGYKGRVALYEVMPMSEELRDMVLSGASASDVKRTAIQVGMMTLRQSGLLKLRQGQTTMEEVIRVTMPD